MEFKLLNRHYGNLIHEYKIDTQSLIPFNTLPLLKKYYLDNIEERKKINNAANLQLTFVEGLRDIEVNAHNELKKLIERFYVTENNFGIGSISLYYSDSNGGSYDWHDHYDPYNISSIGAVFYWHNMEKDNGGEISFKRPHLPEYRIMPQVDRLYTFPYWLAHRPNPYMGKGERYCFNWAYLSSNRIVNKITGDVW